MIKFAETSDGSSARGSRAVHEADQKYGERIADDALVTFCNRLKSALAPRKSRKFEGWFEINTILIFARMVAARRELEKAKLKNNLDEIKALESELGSSEEAKRRIEEAITGKNYVVQILYDLSRNHYVVVLYSPGRSSLSLFDSLLDKDQPHRSLKNISDQIIALFGHLYEGQIPITIDLGYEQQSDYWSCGYRAIACVLDLVFGRIPRYKSWDLEMIHTLLIDCLEFPEMPLEVFEAAMLWTETARTNDDGKEYFDFKLEVFLNDSFSSLNGKNSRARSLSSPPSYNLQSDDTSNARGIGSPYKATGDMRSRACPSSCEKTARSVSPPTNTAVVGNKLGPVEGDTRWRAQPVSSCERTADLKMPTTRTALFGEKYAPVGNDMRSIPSASYERTAQTKTSSTNKTLVNEAVGVDMRSRASPSASYERTAQADRSSADTAVHGNQFGPVEGDMRATALKGDSRHSRHSVRRRRGRSLEQPTSDDHPILRLDKTTTVVIGGYALRATACRIARNASVVQPKAKGGRSTRRGKKSTKGKKKSKSR